MVEINGQILGQGLANFNSHEGHIFRWGLICRLQVCKHITKMGGENYIT